MLQDFVNEHEEGVSEEESAVANAELKNFWERCVGENPAKTGLFVGVLKELRPAIVRQADIMEWWELVVKPVITATGYKKQAQDDAQAFLVGCMVHEGDVDSDYEDNHAGASTSDRLLGELLSIYISRTRTLTEEDQLIAPENAKVAQHIENVLVAFGRKQPEELFHKMDDLVVVASTRLQALTLLSSFLRHQTPHLYKVAETRLVEDLLKCLMNDTSTTVLSVALTSLIMLLPHIPSSLREHLPRLFLVYSRLLCWEKFSPLSTEAQKSLVTDDRVSTVETDHGDVGIDPTWEKVRPCEGSIESATPEVMTYFTYLYGLYPLNFMSYVRKPRRYLKSCEFPGAEDFDLDQTVIRKRTDQFSAVHLCHPNFYNLTVEEELSDPKWPKSDPADVVADCHSLCVNTKSSLVSPGPPPTAKLPEVPPMPQWANMSRSGQVSPSASYASFRSGNSWRDTQSTAASGQIADGDSPVLRPHDLQQHDNTVMSPRSKASTTHRISPNLDDFPQPGRMSAPRSPKKEMEEAPQTNLAFLQQENILLRNDLNLEKGKVAQYSWHISQLQRKTVKDTTAEAETLNLINANRHLKLQLEQVRMAREATLKDTVLTRKQANSLEAKLSEKFGNLRKEQETWRADAEELRRLRKEIGQYRTLIVRTEERELKKTHHLELVKRDLEKMEDIQRALTSAQNRLREYEYREFEMDRAVRENDILQREKETMQLRMQRQQQDHERSHRVYGEKIAELEAQLEASDALVHHPSLGRQLGSGDVQGLVKQAIADSQAKLAQMKKMHNTLMQKYTNLELEYETVKEQLDAMHGPGDRLTPRAFGGSGSSLDNMSGALVHNDGAFDLGSDAAYVTSTSDPTSRRYQPAVRGLPVSPPSSSEATMHSTAGLTWRPPPPVSRQDSIASRSSGVPATTFNQTAPLGHDEVHGSGKSAFSVGSDDSQKKREKIKPDSQVRVYGRGESDGLL